jgi:hypothetical protein
MSKSLSAFMRPNVAEIKNACFAPSPRFVGEDGKPVEWEIRCISADEYAKIRSDCFIQERVPGKKNQVTQRLDIYAFQTRVAARCTVFPDLKDAALQDSWGVTKPEDLVGAMLIGGEFEDYIKEVLRVNGFKDETELVDEAKN